MLQLQCCGIFFALFSKRGKNSRSHKNLIYIFRVEAHSLMNFMFNFRGAGDTINTTMNADELQYQHYRKGL